MFRRKKQVKTYDASLLKPVLRCSICTGEETAGFQNLKTGKFSEVMLIRSEEDLEEFLAEYGIDRVERIY